MYSGFDDCSLLRTMSESELFLVQENKEEIEFDILRRPKLIFEDGIDLIHWRQEPAEPDANDENNEKQEKNCKIAETTRQPLSLGELKATTTRGDDDDNDGFRTPTSLDQKIPVIKQCPPAPRKPKPLLSTKRKPSSQHPIVRTSLQFLDLSQEVESLFPRPILADLHQKIKKARRNQDIDNTQL